MAAKEGASKYLNEVVPEQCFWVNNGPILKNLEDLANALPIMDSGTYCHHVNKEKNDFSKWISDVIGDKKLAKTLSRAKSKESALKHLRNRLNSLKKKAS